MAVQDTPSTECFIKSENKTSLIGYLKEKSFKAISEGHLKSVEESLCACKRLGLNEDNWVILVEGVIHLRKGLFIKAEKLIRDAYELFNISGDLKGKNLSMLFISKILAYKGDFEGGIILADYIINSDNSLDDNYTYYNAVMHRAFCLSAKGEFNDLLITIKNGEELLRRGGDEAYPKLLERYLAVPYYLKGDYKRAFYYYDKYSELSGKCGDWGEQLAVDIFIARAYRDIGEFRKSKELFTRTIQLKKVYGYSEDLYLAYYHFSMLFSDIGEFDEALKYISLAKKLAESSGIEKWFLDVADGHKSFMLTKCGKRNEGLKIAQKLLDNISSSNHYLFSGALFYTGCTFLENNLYENAKKCIIKAFDISKNAGFRIIECYSAGLLAHIFSKQGIQGQCYEYSCRCLKIAASGGYIQGFISIPLMLDCIKTGLRNGIETEFLRGVLERLQSVNWFRTFEDELLALFFTGNSNEREYIFEMLLRLYDNSAGSDDAPKLIVCTFGGVLIYVVPEGVDIEGWRTNKAKELFTYLLNQKGKAVSSEKLITELWPGTSPAKAKNLLYANVSYVKQKLGQWKLENCIVKAQDGYFFKTDKIICDKWMVDEQLEKYGYHSTKDLPRWILKILHKDFLEGTYSDWVLEEQNKLETVLDQGA